MGFRKFTWLDCLILDNFIEQGVEFPMAAIRLCTVIHIILKSSIEREKWRSLMAVIRL